MLRSFVDAAGNGPTLVMTRGIMRIIGLHSIRRESPCCGIRERHCCITVEPKAICIAAVYHCDSRAWQRGRLQPNRLRGFPFALGFC